MVSFFLPPSSSALLMFLYLSSPTFPLLLLLALLTSAPYRPTRALLVLGASRLPPKVSASPGSRLSQRAQTRRRTCPSFIAGGSASRPSDTRSVKWQQGCHQLASFRAVSVGDLCSPFLIRAFGSCSQCFSCTHLLLIHSWCMLLPASTWQTVREE